MKRFDVDEIRANHAAVRRHAECNEREPIGATRVRSTGGPHCRSTQHPFRLGVSAMKLGIILESFAIRSATLLSPGLLCLAGCYCDTGTGGGYGVTVSGSASANGCIDWYTYDDDWHRRHCNDPGYVWCNAPNGGLGATPSYDSGVTSGETVDSGATSSAMPDGALPTADSGSGGQASDSGSAAADGGAGSTGDAGDGAVLGACTTSASCAVGSSCVGGSCQPCSGGVCVCQRDDD